jgi:hypothetical protein
MRVDHLYVSLPARPHVGAAAAGDVAHGRALDALGRNRALSELIALVHGGAEGRAIEDPAPAAEGSMLRVPGGAVPSARSVPSA